MAILLPKSVFVHLPKTGGVWVESVLQEAGLVRGHLGHRHAKGPDINGSTEFQQRAISFTFVRHPLHWYQSYWAYKVREQWNDANNEFDSVVQSDSFIQFLDNVMSFFPGYFSGVVDRFTSGVTFVGKQERLVPDLILALTLAGEDFDASVIRSKPPLNVSSQDAAYRARCMYSPRLADQIMKMDRKVVAVYGYDYIPDGCIHIGDV